MYLLEVPVDGGGHLLVQASEDELPDGLDLASLRPGQVAARLGESLDGALEQLKPALAAVRRQLAAMRPDEIEVEFGVVLGAEAGAVVAKGTTDVHFTVKLTWKHEHE